MTTANVGRCWMLRRRRYWSLECCARLECLPNDRLHSVACRTFNPSVILVRRSAIIYGRTRSPSGKSVESRFRSAFECLWHSGTAAIRKSQVQPRDPESQAALVCDRSVHQYRRGRTVDVRSRFENLVIGWHCCVGLKTIGRRDAVRWNAKFQLDLRYDNSWLWTTSGTMEWPVSLS